MEFGILSKPIIPSVFLCMGIAVYLSQYITLKSHKKVVLQKRTKNKSSGIYNIIYSWFFRRLENKEWYLKLVSKIQFNIGYFSSESERKNKLKAEKFVVNNIIKVIIEILIIGIFVKTDIVMKVFIIIGVNLVKLFFYRNNITIKKNKLKNEFPLLVKEFITNYVDKLNVTEAFQLSTNNMSPVYQVHINRLISQLHSGKPAAESLMAFDDRIGYIMCSSFVSIIQSAFNTNRNVITNLLELESLIAQERARSKKFKDKLQEKKSNINFLIVGLIIEIVFMGSYAKTNTGNYFLTTIDGQALLLGTIVASVFAILMTIYVELL